MRRKILRCMVKNPPRRIGEIYELLRVENPCDILGSFSLRPSHGEQVKRVYTLARATERVSRYCIFKNYFNNPPLPAPTHLISPIIEIIQPTISTFLSGFWKKNLNFRSTQGALLCIKTKFLSPLLGPFS